MRCTHLNAHCSCKTFVFLSLGLIMPRTVGEIIIQWMKKPTKLGYQTDLLLFFSCSAVSNSLWAHRLKHARLPCPSLSPRACSNSCPLSWWCHPTISSFVVSSPSAFNLSQHQGLFKWVSSLHQVAKELEFQLQHQSFQWIFRIDFL